MKISPSMLACDFSNMENEIKKLKNADMVHMDVMDGHFVPNISFGPDVIKSLRKHSNLPFDVHLMISEPYKYIENFVESGADIITFHIESNSDVNKTIDKIHSLGKKVGLAIKPKTPLENIYKYINKIDLALIMTVEPGFGGQLFMYSQMEKVKKLKENIKSKSLDVEIEIDGGVNINTINFAYEFGVDICVAGTSVFNSDDISACIKKLKHEQ